MKIIKYLIFVISIICALIAGAKISFAEDKAALFNKELTYNIYYQVNDSETNRADNVKLSGITKIDNVTFLIVQFLGAVAREGYIALDSIKAIIPGADNSSVKSKI